MPDLSLEKKICFWKHSRQRERQDIGLHVSPCDLSLSAGKIWGRGPVHSCCLNLRRVLHLTAWPAVQPLTRLSVTARLAVGGGEVVGDFWCAQMIESKSVFHTNHTAIIILSLLCLHTEFVSPLYPPSILSPLSTPSEGKEDKGKAHMEVRVNINAPDLSWVLSSLQHTFTQHFNAALLTSIDALPLLQ